MFRRSLLLLRHRLGDPLSFRSSSSGPPLIAHKLNSDPEEYHSEARIRLAQNSFCSTTRFVKITSYWLRRDDQFPPKVFHSDVHHSITLFPEPSVSCMCNAGSEAGYLTLPPSTHGSDKEVVDSLV
ncbi:hypothetical protein VNO77_23346 [Canavalia gladiata]|uniref:Uncharacterized protein n=1 Tax=Canavalia gladiata TaxID=3824 RepID=A0AAN9QBF2_CANGL